MKVGFKQSALIAAAAAASPLLFDLSSARGQNVSDSTWLQPAAGSWAVATNWDSDPNTDPDATPNYPNGAGSSATFNINGSFSSTQNVTLDAPITLGALSITNNIGPTARIFALVGDTTNNMTFDTVSGPVMISIAGTSTQPSRLNAPMVFNDDVVVNVVGDSTGTAGHFLLGGTVVGTGGFTKTGSGRMTFANTPGLSGLLKEYTGATLIQNGRVRMSADGIPIATSSFTIEDRGQLTPIAGSGDWSPGGGTAVLSIAGNGPTDGPDAAFAGAIRPDANLDITFTNPVLLPGGQAVIHSRSSSGFGTPGSITFTNQITGAGTLVLSADVGDNQLGTYVLSNATSDYTGGTVVWGGTVDATLGRLGATTGALTVNVINFSGAQSTVLLNTSAANTTGSLSGTSNGNLATINVGHSLTVNQTTAGTYQGRIIGTGGFTKGGAESLTVNQMKIGGALAVDGGTLAITANGGAAGMVEATAVTVGAALLQMNDNDLMVNYTGTSPEFALRDLVKAVAEGGTSGIGFEAGDGNRVLAIAEGTESGLSDLNGVTFADDTVVIGKHTYYGDANLDGAVTSDDYVAVDVGIGVGDSWVEGDFDFSGTVTSDDYVAIDVNLGQGSPNPLAFAELKAEMVALHTAMFGDEYVQRLAIAEADGFAALVPEPGALSLVGLGAAGLLGRRRRQA